MVYPPIKTPEHDTTKTNHKNPTSEKYFLIVSRLYKHKNVDIAVKAFSKLGWPLVVIGNGPEKNKLEKIAGKNVKILGFVPDDELSQYYKNCLAFVMPQGIGEAEFVKLIGVDNHVDFKRVSSLLSPYQHLLLSHV